MSCINLPILWRIMSLREIVTKQRALCFRNLDNHQFSYVVKENNKKNKIVTLLFPLLYKEKGEKCKPKVGLNCSFTLVDIYSIYVNMYPNTIYIYHICIRTFLWPWIVTDRPYQVEPWEGKNVVNAWLTKAFSWWFLVILVPYPLNFPLASSSA